MAILLSINIGTPRPTPGRSSMTGIYKEPLAEGDSIGVSKQGLEGDAIINRKHHGGVDQAVYVYFADDYDYWSKTLERELKPGTFGENLTIGGVEGRAVSVGDRFRIDKVVLEVTSHRTPCATFAARMGSPGWVKQFFQAGRPGAYCRVIEAGDMHAGAPVTYRPFEGDRISVSELLSLEGERNLEPDLMQRVLRTPVHYKMRADYENRLAKLF